MPLSGTLHSARLKLATAAPPGWRRFLAFSGPAYLVSVGYMDPGNWATDLEGGARFGYQLLWVLVLSNAMAILMQHLAAKLGLATGRDLAQSCRDLYPRPVAYALWALCEAAIAACDLAEILGAAIALKLLFGLPLLAGLAITAFDTLLILTLARFGMRKIERLILGFVALIGGCFAVQLVMAQPDLGGMVRGLVPQLDGESLYVAVAILGATVMPHNLYLYSALVQTRRIGESTEAKREASRYNLIDSAIALNAALFVNAGILVLAAATFHRHGVAVTEIEQAHQLLSPLLGTTMAGILFAVALLASGQSSTVTGTMAGQIVMEGFLSLRMRPWLRRLLTRLAALAPAVAVILLAGEAATYQLLIASQVVLSLQLPFAVIPLVRFTSSAERMGPLANRRVLRIAATVVAAFIVSANAWLATRILPPWGWVVAGVPLLVLLAFVAFAPLERRRHSVIPAFPADPQWTDQPYRVILVPLDHSDLDASALRHSVSLARSHGAELILVHVEEGVASLVYGQEAGTAEEEEGARYLGQIVARLKQDGLRAQFVVRYSSRPREEIVRLARECRADLVVMGAHGHQGLKDLIFGSTINAVRHELEIPVLAVRK